MAGRTKVQNFTEVQRWFEEGRTYDWMVEQYREKYNIETTRSMWANIRIRHGFEPRAVIDRELIPWRVAEEHERAYQVQMLRILARRRAGKENSEDYDRRLDSWLETLKEKNAVVHYDRDLGFFYVPREEQDTDVIRQPKGPRR